VWVLLRYKLDWISKILAPSSIELLFCHFLEKTENIKRIIKIHWRLIMIFSELSTHSF
jgi:hypothetical protein